MYNYIQDIIRDNKFALPDNRKIEMLVTFRSMLDEYGFFSKLDEKSRTIHIYDDEFDLKSDFIIDCATTEAFLVVKLPCMRERLTEEQYKLIVNYNNNLRYGSIDYDKRDVFYISQVEWAPSASDQTIKAMVSRVFQGYTGDRETLAWFRDDVDDLQ